MDKKREERIMSAIANIQRSKLNEYYGKVQENIDRGKIRNKALKEFKARTGLVGKELQEAWKKYWDRENNRPYENYESESEEEVQPVKKRGRPKKEYKEISVMKAKSDLVKNGDKWAVETNMNIRPTIDDKTKRALKKSVIGEINRQLKGIERKN